MDKPELRHSSLYATCDFLKHIIHTETTVLCSVCESIATFVSVLLSPIAGMFPIKDRRIFIEKRFMDPKISDCFHYIRQIKVLSRNVIVWNYVPL